MLREMRDVKVGDTEECPLLAALLVNKERCLNYANLNTVNLHLQPLILTF